MSEIGETFRAFNEHKREKKRTNLESSISILKERNIDFCMLSPIHIRVNSIYDFWPSTGLYICNKTNKRGRGIFNLLREILKT